jgi:hypothetical protein
MARRSKTSRTKVREISQAKNRKITNTSPNGKRTQISGLTEVTRLKRELEKALQQQIATENILKVVSSSPDNVQPVFDAIVNSAAMLFAQCTAVITTLKDDKLQWNALATLRSDFDVSGAKAVYPLPFDPDRSPSAPVRYWSTASSKFPILMRRTRRSILARLALLVASGAPRSCRWSTMEEVSAPSS